MSPLRSVIGLVAGALIALTWPESALVAAAQMPDLAATTRLLASGSYAACIEAAAERIEKGTNREGWPAVLARAQLAIGRYDDAFATCERALEDRQFGRSVVVRWLGRAAAMRIGRQEQADAWLAEIVGLVGSRGRLFADPASRVVAGRAALAGSADPRTVMETYFQPAARDDAAVPDGFIALGELALAKGDPDLALETFQAAATRFPDDPDVALGLGLSLAETDPQRAEKELARALEINPAHVPTLLVRVEQAIDAEDRAGAGKLIERILAINPHQPQAWAYRASLHLLAENEAEAEVARRKAIGDAKKDPEVDHIIGRMLSRNYRFKEAAAYQRRALEIDPGSLPARAALAQDLLRLGVDDEGWSLVKQAQEADPYDVPLFNLMQLRDDLDAFATLESEHLILRMERLEAAVFGPDVLELLERSRRELCSKYGLALEGRIVVEMYPRAADFAVRTFGMPGGGGVLGACFGKVITLKSPAAYAEGGAAANWQSTLWHEFCHTVTLESSRNRMPRWLSEGISVHEERAADPAWGQRMNDTNREWILAGRLTPIAEMSGAFLHPPSPKHLMFAYYQASLVVDFLVEQFSVDAMKTVLRDLGAGVPIDKAFAAHMVAGEKLERDFRAYAEQRARDWGPGLDWTTHDLTDVLAGGPEAIDRWLAEHPTNKQALEVAAAEAIRAKKYAKAQPLLEKLVALLPEQQGANCAYERLAQVHRLLGDATAEREVLERYSQHAESAADAEARLLELQLAAGDWPAAERTVRKLIAVRPMSVTAMHAKGLCAAERGDHAVAARAFRAVLELDPEHAADTHYRLARSLHAVGDAEAKRHVLLALETAPRYRDAQRLLLEIVRQQPAPARAETEEQP